MAIIGGGPLCTYALERLAALLPGIDHRPNVRISVFDATGLFGSGATHAQNQSPTNYMNRTASQITFAADDLIDGAGPLLPRALRPTFAQWAQSRYAATGDSRFDLGPCDVPRRYLHGIALGERFDLYVSKLRSLERLEVLLLHAEVADIAEVPEGNGLCLQISGSSRHFRADQVLLVTGHSQNRPAAGSLAARLQGHAEDNPPVRFVMQPYPLETQLPLDAPPPGARVALLGMGLTAVDVILHLTEGRGGRFEPKTGEAFPLQSYVPSGQEPSVIIATSPSGMFPWCRPRNLKARDPSGDDHATFEHRGVFLTHEAVRTLRHAVGTAAIGGDGQPLQIDFEHHVFPLVVLEFAYLYYSVAGGDALAQDICDTVADRYQAFLRVGCKSAEAAIDWLLEPIDLCFGKKLSTLSISAERFDWRAVFYPLGSPEDGGSPWAERVVAFMRRDILAAAEGNLSNPLKAACDGVWRDLRAVLSEAVDFGGLTPQSHQLFRDVHLRLYSRMSNGTGQEAMSKILALIEHSLVDVSMGPGPTVLPAAETSSFSVVNRWTGETKSVDFVVKAIAHPFDLDLDVRPLYRNLLRRGLVRRWRNRGATREEDFIPGGLDVTHDFHSVRANGKVEPRLTILGAPVEGVAFFQLSAARLGSPVLAKASNWAKACVDIMLHEQFAAGSEAHNAAGD
ncbi:hypothetical protein X757_03230 [Mesorhizobium sp. LSHC414A00]|nr:hypothetical protein X757_03230 [Mesorhizobium sp. LSHC414A00]